MRKSAQIVITQHEQEKEETWELVNAFISDWNATRSYQFVSVADVLWKLSIDDLPENDEAFERLTLELIHLKKDIGLVYHLVRSQEAETADYQTAAFISIFGISLDGLSQPFILNEAEALQTGSPCPGCGNHDYFSREQVAPFVINEDLLSHELEDFTKPESHADWDLINIVGGRLLISKQLADLLTEHQARDYHLKDVHNPEGQVSQRVFQLEADQSILIPCAQVINPALNLYCEICGVGIQGAEQTFDISKEQGEHIDFFARHPNRSAMIYVSNRIFTAMNKANLSSIIPNEVANFC